MEIKWTEDDEQSGERVFVKAERFARKWKFFSKVSRRSDWEPVAEPPRAYWEYLLAALEAKYRYRDGVDESDVADVQRVLARWRDKPTFGG
ncbi:hypothetical protein [Tuwongella immobilis]|uniref:Uncharacterized protein n=1 Tax=Tuwongella immobilis TaxID=692036 RepID=A0A6C2YVH6_9BACT|nr:hypothetical protein [Tuwongella immobilis]VIP04872.1 unnamed protein product [Tuwongella immobilis]VTS07103.1 unnamed protein product [Tuwongella immobilis]